MSTNHIELVRNKGNPTIEVIIGHANFGTYKIKLWDDEGEKKNRLTHKMENIK